METTNNLIALAHEARLDTFMSFQWLTGMNLLGVVFVLVFAVGYLLRRVESVDNKYMWMLIPAGTVLYAWLATKPGSASRDYGLNGVFGCVACTIAVIAVVLAHDRLARALAAKVPFLSFLASNGEGKPRESENQNEKNPPPS